MTVGAALSRPACLRSNDRIPHPPVASVGDFRARARRKLPKAIFEFIDGGAGREKTVGANVRDFEEWAFLPRVLTDLPTVDTSTTVLGTTLPTPVLIAPAGGQRMAHPEGELATAAAAAAVGTVFTLATGASRTIEEVAAASGPGAHLWFQLYFWGDRAWTERLIGRARSQGYETLCVTVDTKTPTDPQYRSVRNGIRALPESLNRHTLRDAWRRPAWLAGYLRGGPIRTVNDLIDDRSQSHTYDPRATWKELAWIRSVWSGPLVVKGIMTADDAAAAFRHGADAVVCSNHGGRMMDGVASTISVLPQIVEIADRVGGEVLLDGGIRSGGDVVKALALGARACLIGRPFWWGLAAGGRVGVEQVLDLLTLETRSAMTQLGVGATTELAPEHLTRTTRHIEGGQR